MKNKLSAIRFGAGLALALGALPWAPARAQTPAGPAAPTAVKTVHPHRGEITRSVTLPGELQPYQQATLCAKVSGYLKNISVDKGDEVKAGDRLAEVEVPELLADQAKYRAEKEVAAIDFKRVSESQKQAPDLVTPQVVDEAGGRLRVAQANLDRVETLLGFGRITAPFSGIVTRRFVDPGAFIPAATASGATAGAALLTLMDFQTVRLQVAAPEMEATWVAKGQPVSATMEELPGRVFRGTVTRFAYALDPATKTMLVEAELPNPKLELRPGMYASVKIGVERRTDALLAPVEALVMEKANAFVFTVADHKAKKVPVKTGFNDGAFFEIQSGASAADVLILVGKQSFTDGQPVTPTEVP